MYVASQSCKLARAFRTVELSVDSIVVSSSTKFEYVVNAATQGRACGSAPESQ